MLARFFNAELPIAHRLAITSSVIRPLRITKSIASTPFGADKAWAKEKLCFVDGVVLIVVDGRTCSGHVQWVEV